MDNPLLSLIDIHQDYNPLTVINEYLLDIVRLSPFIQPLERISCIHVDP